MNITGIDIGGYTIKHGIVEKDKLIINGQTETPRSYGELISVVNDIISDYNSDVVGIGIPGLVKDGIILNAPNLGIRQAPFLKSIKAEKAVLINDAEAAMVAESAYGVAKGVKYAVLMTIGTGIGGAILIDGKLYNGNGGAAEFGHILSYGAAYCGCGMRGCFETAASASALEKQYEKLEHVTISAKQIFELADRGDESAVRLVDSYIKTLAKGILSIANILRPELVILGGGMSERKDELLEPLKIIFESREYGYPGAPSFEIATARFTSTAGIIGAAEHARVCFE